MQTVDGLTTSPNGNRGLSGTRVERQSFQVTSNLTVGKIYLSTSTYGGTAFTVSFFAVTDTLATAELTGGTQVGSTFTVQAGTAATGNRNLEISLDPSEQLTLPAATAPAGYVMTVALVDTAGAAAFNWVHSNTGTDLYTAGRYRRDDGDTTATRDFGLALAPVPEPSSSALASAGALGMIGLRRRRA